MRPLKPRQERFCRYFAQYACAATAARVAGYEPKWARSAGYRLMRHPRIAARIAEVQAEMAPLHGPADEVLLGKLENIYRRAIAHGQLHAAVRAVDLQAKLRARAAAAATTAGSAEDDSCLPKKRSESMIYGKPAATFDDPANCPPHATAST